LKKSIFICVKETIMLVSYRRKAFLTESTEENTMNSSTTTGANRLSILRIDSSARREQSITRKLGDEVVHRLLREYPQAKLMVRDLADPINPIDFIDAHWVHANLIDPAERHEQQRNALADSDRLVAELDTADIIVLTTPVYNFSVPAALKAWIDMVCRARLSFRYTENGPQGILRDKPVYLIMASGGMPFGSPVDFASGYLRHIFNFIGIHDVRMVQAERTGNGVGASERVALDMINQWLPVAAPAAIARA
jgi:FMN-dependent NADH-azoreductase